MQRNSYLEKRSAGNFGDDFKNRGEGEFCPDRWRRTRKKMFFGREDKDGARDFWNGY